MIFLSQEITEKQASKKLSKSFVKELIQSYRKNISTTEHSLYLVRKKRSNDYTKIAYQFCIVPNIEETNGTLANWKSEDVVFDYVFLHKFDVSDFTQGMIPLSTKLSDEISPILNEQVLKGFFSTKIEFFNKYDYIYIKGKEYFVHTVDLTNRIVYLSDKQAQILKITEVNLLNQMSEWVVTLDTLGINVPEPSTEELSKYF